MKTGPVQDAIFHADRQTDRLIDSIDDTNSRSSQFCERT